MDRNLALVSCMCRAGSVQAWRRTHVAIYPLPLIWELVVYGVALYASQDTDIAAIAALDYVLLFCPAVCCKLCVVAGM